MLELKEEDASRTALRKRCFKITNHMMKLVDPDLHNHLQEVENKPLHAQKEIHPNENKDSDQILTFDDTSDSPVIYGKDLQILAFIRRRHD